MRPSDSLIPDSFTGAIAALEGIQDAAVLLNSPTGCKFYHGAISETQMPRAHDLDPLLYSEEFYFGQPRVPATFLDDYDYVFGATDKLEKILPAVAKKGHGLIGVINSPGAALIGDDLDRFIENAGLGLPCIAMENPGFSDPLPRGFQQAAIQVLTALSPCPGTAKEAKTVNLMGLSIFHHLWEGNLEALSSLLGACGIRVNTCICAGTTLNGLKNIPAAQINLVVHEEYAQALVSHTADHFAMESLVPPLGAPVGFTASESWLESVCARLDADPGPGLDIIQKARHQAYRALNRFNAFTGLPKGASFAIEADGSVVLPLVKWLYEYLGMVPVSVRTIHGTRETRQKIKTFLEQIHCTGAWEADPGTPDIFLASGAAIAGLRLTHPGFTGIELALPAGTFQHVIPKTYMGPQGGLYLIEQIINGLAAGC